MLYEVITARREDRPERDVVDRLAASLTGLLEAVRGSPDSQPRSRGRRDPRRGKVSLTEMDAIRIGRERQIEAIVHEEADVELARDRPDRLGPGERLRVGRVLGAQSYNFV